MKERNKQPAQEPDKGREEAERRLQAETASVEGMTGAEVSVVVHELRVHQIELQMQNEELREAQVELEQSRSRYAELFDFAPIGYLVFNAGGLVVEANLTAASMLGIERGRLIGQPFSPHVAPASRDTWRLHYTTVFKTGRKQQSEIELARAGKAPLIVRLHSRPVTGEDDKVVQCRTSMTDITALVRTEQRLRDSERRFRTLAENSPDIIVRIDADLQIRYANKHVEDALGIPPGEAVGRSLGQLDAPEDLVDAWTAAIRQTFQTGRLVHTEFHCDSPWGLRYYGAAVAPEFGEDRTVQTVLVSVRDITARVQAEETYSTIINNSLEAFSVIDSNGRFLDVNRAYSRLLGYSREEMLTMSVADIEALETPEQVHQRLGSLAKAEHDHFQTQLKRRDGTRVTCDVLVQKLNGDQVFAFVRDITEQQAAENERMTALQRLELVSEATSDGIWDLDIPADAFWHNEAYLTAFGYAPDEPGISRVWWQERIHPQDRPEVLATLDTALQGNQDLWTARYRFQRNDGSYAWIMARARILRDEQGRAVRIVGSMMDLSEKLELVDQLETERTKLATILDTALAGIVVVDAEARVTYVNPTAQAFFGHPPPRDAPFATREAVEICDPDGRRYEWRQLPLIRSALDGETCSQVELLIKWPDGRQSFTLVNTSPLRTAQGNLVGAMAVFLDITARKQAEQALRQARDEMEQRVRERTHELDETVATLQEEVAEKIEAQNQLLRHNEILQKIINNIPLMLCFFDAAGRVGMVNEGFTQVLGYSLEDFREHTLVERCFPAPVRQEVWEHLLLPEPLWRDFFAQTTDGSQVISSWATVQLADGSYVGIGIDIRERTRFENRLRENEQRYRTLVEMSPDAISVECDGLIAFVNSTALRLFGATTPEEIVGRPLLDFFPPDYQKRVDRQFTRLRKSRKPMATTEEKIQRLDGMALDIELAAMPIVFEGQPANQVVLRDITQRKQVETKLRDNAMKLQQQAQLLDLAHDSIVVNDMEGRIAFWNRGAEQTYGWTQKEAVGQISHELLQTRFPLNLIEITAKLLSQGRWNGELTHTTRTGETIIVSSRWALQRDENGRPSGILVIDRDITQQKRAEQATIEAWRFAESVTNTVQESLLVLDQDLRIVSANQTFYKTFEVSPEETQGRLIYELGNGQWDLPELRKLLEDILPHNSSFENYEVEYDFEHIGHRVMLLNARQIYRQSQETQMILLAVTDITVRKEQERKIHQHQQELAGLTEELLLTEERERRRLALLLHDSIGQSLAFSKREIGVLQKNMPPEIRKALEYVKQQIDESIRQTRDLTFELSPTTLYTFGLEAAVEELAEQFAQREGFQYHFEASDDDKPLTEQMQALLYRASRELLTNISKHAEASDVFIRIDRIGDNIRIVIEDNGKGFDTGQLERIMHQQQGFGLLSIRERLTHVGGTFAIESQPGHGTKVTLVAPLHQSN
jgi:PAS domain S-box-containing protein